MRFPLNRLPISTGKKTLHRSVAKPTVGPWDWIGLPALVCLAVTLILSTPIKIGVFSPPEPILPLVLAFSWALVRPSYIAPFALAALGLFLDYYWGAPLGFYALLLMIVYGVFVMTRAYVAGQETLVIIAVYGLTCLAFFATATLIVTMISGTVPRVIGVLEQFFATFACFPVVLYMLETYLHSDARFQ